MKLARPALLSLLLLFALLALPHSASACPNCKDAYMEADGANVAAGYNSSIMLMIGVPIALLGASMLRMWWTVKRAQQRAFAAVPGIADPPIDTTR